MTGKFLEVLTQIFGKRPRLQPVYVCMVFGMLTIASCEIEEPQISYVVDVPLQVYFDRFIHEAAARDLDVEYATYQVDAQIGDIIEKNVIGQCAWSGAHQHSITIDEQYWRTANDLQREFVVFHELGHCVLGRDHIDGDDVNGNCVSVMTSGTGPCRILYNSQNRNELLDELFAEN